MVLLPLCAACEQERRGGRIGEEIDEAVDDAREERDDE
jgi:hypothetical protein